ncbi:KAP family NTPase [Desulfobaculum bizertense]|uniref:P-loop NTPase fold protein n=1 Tax=Desulfobaculum bizertense TaxID=376490 RepID=UPI001F2C3292|nr:P-loop NTPase fold protein [Desulfobaculum bizertense]UIJ38543.1 KAP family NTPase [Desulfobaculum bizertense]
MEIQLLPDTLGLVANAGVLAYTWLCKKNEWSKERNILPTQTDCFDEGMDKYLESYVTCKAPADHAVMIDGPWGSGKTYYIQNFIQRMEEEHKDLRFIMVSLYGVDSVAALETEMVRAACPLLTSKPVIIGTAVAKSLLKGWAKIDIDWNGDGKKDAEIDIKAFEKLFNKNDLTPKDAIFVFDDVERCDVKANTVWGQINNFVERDECKVILIANRDELCKRKKGGEETEFKKMEEKIVGKTLKIKKDKRRIILDILKGKEGDLEDDLVEFLKGKKEDVALWMVAKDGKAENYRIFKSFIWEFSNIWKPLNTEIKENKAFLDHFFEHFYKYYFLMRKFGLNSSFLDEIRVSAVSKVRLENKKLTSEERASIEKKIVPYFDEVYSYWGDFIEFDYIPFPLWGKILNGRIDSAELNTQLLGLHLFRQKAGWYPLADVTNLNDEEVELALTSAKESLANNDFKDIRDVVYFASVLTNVHEWGVLPDAEYTEMWKKLKKCRNAWENEKISEQILSEIDCEESWGESLNMKAVDSTSDLYKFLAPLKRRACELSLVKNRASIRELLCNDRVTEELSFDFEGRQGLRLVNLEVEEFLEIMKENEGKTLKNTWQILSARSHTEYLSRSPETDRKAIEWIDSVLAECDEVKLKGRMSKFYWEKIKECLPRVRKKIEEHQKKHE